MGGNQFELTEPFRQTDSLFFQLLNELRMGRVSKEAELSLKACVGRVQEDDARLTRLFPHRADVERTNKLFLGKLEGDTHQYTARDSGKAGALEFLKKNCPASELVELKVGARVVLLANLDAEHGLVNGACGTVVDFKNVGLPTVRFDATGREEPIVRHPFHSMDGKRVAATREQVPLALAYALTIHKSQGMTLDAVSVKVETVFSAGQLYVALSRARSIEGLSLSSFSMKAVRADAASVAFCEGLAKAVVVIE